MTRRRRYRFDKAIIALICAALLYAGLMIWLHPRILYPFRSDRFSAPEFEARLVQVQGAEPIEIQLSEGRKGAPVVLYFMGNVGSLVYFEPMLAHHVSRDRTVVGMTFRGAGGVPGQSSERTLKRDALAVADHVRALYPDAPLVVQGYSLGTGLAVHVAARRAVDGVILSAPFDALCRLMAKRSGLPACLLPVQRWRTDRDAPMVRAPVLVQHGTGDRVIPFVSGMRLVGHFEDAGVPLTFGALQGARHGDMMSFPEHQTRIDNFIFGLR
ncbi:alpha/beta hydrolase [Sulfitobacter aestuariivivens]|uniref:Alpha/beta hydrolase n=1 Tax=Sulfitobacter aestuariivivens TaxID=2766981 RepID=A0A927HCV3_9RHOB|nr:alpha/beta fold hydrolase [Sulfitobacter aestuariivivens]MBD3662977.1 alpha/beta hydrolase [Sulfitobacter aestuariivivens]